MTNTITGTVNMLGSRTKSLTHVAYDLIMDINIK